MTDSPARAYAERLAVASPLAAAALVFGDLVEEADRRRAEIRVHRFDSTEDVRAAANRDEIGDGDVFVVEPERVTGFLVVTLPVAITEERGSVLHLNRPAREYAAGEWVDSVVVAERESRALGFLLRDEDPEERIRSMLHLANETGDRVRTNPDPTDPEWKAALARLTVALKYLGEHDPATADAINAEALRLADTAPRAANHWALALKNHA